MGRLTEEATPADPRFLESALVGSAVEFFEMESRMRRVKWSTGRAGQLHLLKLAMVAILVVGGLGFEARCMAQPAGQRTFDSPAAAVNALFAAVRSNDLQALLAILGPDSNRIISSGDAAEDADNRANFVSKYDQMHRLAKEPDGTDTLYVGAENWPMPIPIAQSGHVWYFDTEAGKREILYRRIGRNEMSAIRVLEELVAAQKEYLPIYHAYAGRIFSTAGTHDGLYWDATGGEAKSPIGPLVARAVATGDASEHRNVTPIPYRGYYYHMLTSQGPHAPGGAHTYRADGKMTGFAFVAYPAEYRSSGVMTFIVGTDGIVYQKNVGKRTDEIARAMSAYDPDPSWQRAEQQAAESVGAGKAH